MPGIEADLSVGGLEVMASLGVELKKLNEHNAALAQWRKREWERSRVPSMVRMFNSLIIPTPTVRAAVSLDGPSPGFYWMLRRLIIGGTTWKTTAAGTAEIYVTGLSGVSGQAITGPIVNALALSDMVDQASSLPSKAYYSDQQVMIQANENLVVVIDTGTAGQQYVVTAQFQVFRTIAADTYYET